MSLRARDGLEQAADHAVLIYVDPLCSGNLRETGHSHYITGKSNDKACACAYLQIAHSDREVLGCAQLLGVIGEGILCFGHADRELVKAQLCQLLALLDGGADELYAVCVVDLGADRIQLIHDGKVEFVGLAEIIGKFAEADNFFCQCFAAFAALCPDFGEGDIDAELFALGFDHVELSLGVSRESVDSNDAGKAEDILDVADVLQKVRKTLFKSVEVFIVQISLRHATVILQGADSCYDDDCAGMEIRETALDVEELLGAEICGDMVCYTI